MPRVPLGGHTSAKRVSFLFPSLALRNASIGTDGPVQRLFTGKFGAGAVAPSELQVANTGACHITFRTSVVKLAGLKLFGIGLACALVAAANTSTHNVRNCALSAAICTVAAYFYLRIWELRDQRWRGGTGEAAKLVSGSPSEEEAAVRKKLHVQEHIVDSLRATDWTVTVHAALQLPFFCHIAYFTPARVFACPHTQLVLMALETYGTIEHLQADTAASERSVPQISMLWSALLQALVVQVGLVYKFYFNSLRGHAPKPAADLKAATVGTALLDNTQVKGERSPPEAKLISFLTFAAALGMFSATTHTTIQYIDEGKYADAKDREMSKVLALLTYMQIGYPLVAFFEMVWLLVQNLPYNEYSENLSTVKDVAYAVLDVTTKAGGALVAFLIATRP